MTSAPLVATSSAGAVAAADHRAADVGARILAAGGTAADAAVATNAVMAVLAPHLCGMGGDLFALVHEPGRPTPSCVFAAGRAGSGADAAAMRAEGLTAMPLTGDLRSVTVPAAVDGWLLLHREHGRLPLADLLEPAAELAEQGFGVSPLMAPSAPRVAALRGGEDFAGITAAAQTMRRPGVARTLRALAAEGRDGFYGGEFGAGLLALGQELEAPLFDEADLATPLAELVDPLRVRVAGHDVWSTPAPTQGYLLLLGLAVADAASGGLGALPQPGDPAWAHLLAEAARIAAYDRVDRLHDTADLAALLADTDDLARRAGMVGPTARLDLPGAARDGDTTYLCAVDGEGRGVSLIQSNALGYGALLMEPSTGINLHNRGIGFSLTEGHPAELRPGARPPHTLTPALVTRADGSLRAVTGTMGGDAQPQIMLQLISRMLGSQDAGEAMAAARFRFGVEGSGFDTWLDPHAVRLELETGHPQAWRTGLEALGHPVVEADFGGGFGHAATIEVDEHGVRHAAADPRAVVGGVATT
ncbi:gamma-glutamyltransferase family protein [Nocardioidaceae bacterium]|nr:gamma-glutamyltransferase family protein [Nocardioidaceae bacterium]